MSVIKARFFQHPTTSANVNKRYYNSEKTHPLLQNTPKYIQKVFNRWSSQGQWEVQQQGNWLVMSNAALYPIIINSKHKLILGGRHGIEKELGKINTINMLKRIEGMLGKKTRLDFLNTLNTMHKKGAILKTVQNTQGINGANHYILAMKSLTFNAYKLPEDYILIDSTYEKNQTIPNQILQTIGKGGYEQIDQVK